MSGIKRYKAEAAARDISLNHGIEAACTAHNITNTSFKNKMREEITSMVHDMLLENDKRSEEEAEVWRKAGEEVAREYIQIQIQIENENRKKINEAVTSVIEDMIHKNPQINQTEFRAQMEEWKEEKYEKNVGKELGKWVRKAQTKAHELKINMIGTSFWRESQSRDQKDGVSPTPGG